MSCFPKSRLFWGIQSSPCHGRARGGSRAQDTRQEEGQRGLKPWWVPFPPVPDTLQPQGTGTRQEEAPGPQSIPGAGSDGEQLKSNPGGHKPRDLGWLCPRAAFGDVVPLEIPDQRPHSGEGECWQWQPWGNFGKTIRKGINLPRTGPAGARLRTTIHPQLWPQL